MPFTIFAKNGLAGKFDDEIVPLTTTMGVMDKETKEVSFKEVTLEKDEGNRPGTTVENLQSLQPVFKDGQQVKEGKFITAGNASQISDGAAACIVTTMDRAEALGITPLAEVVSHGQVAGPDASLLHQPSNAIGVALDRAGLTVADMDLLEINEAFAAVALASMDALGVTDEIVNVNGGAIALGHPIGMSGTRIVLTLAHELARRGGGLGAAGLCGGGGQGEAMVLRVAA